MTKSRNNRIDYLISRRNAQMMRVQAKYNERIEFEIKKLKRRGVM